MFADARYMHPDARQSSSTLTLIPLLITMSESRVQPELMSRADRILADWKALEKRASKVHDELDDRKMAFYEMIYIQIVLQTNLHELYNAGAY